MEGAKTHTSVSGVAHKPCSSDVDALLQLRNFLRFLPVIQRSSTNQTLRRSMVLQLNDIRRKIISDLVIARKIAFFYELVKVK